MADPKKKRKLYIQASSILTPEKAASLDRREKLRKMDPESAGMLDDMDRKIAGMNASTNILSRATDKTEKAVERLNTLREANDVRAGKKKKK